MTNTEIIINEALANGLYKKEQIEDILASGHMIPLHKFKHGKVPDTLLKRENTQESLLAFGNSRIRQRKVRRQTKIQRVRKTITIT